MLSRDLLDMLICPETHAPLRLADEALLQRMNQAIGRRSLKSRNGEALQTPLDGALVREDGKVAYPIIDQIPVMLIDSGIELAQLGDS